MNMKLSEEQIHCKKVSRKITELVHDFCNYEIPIVVDNKTYFMGVIMEPADYKNFELYRMNSEFYESLPTDNEVCIPIFFHDALRGIEAQLSGIHFLSCKGTGYQIRKLSWHIKEHSKFYCIPKSLFFEYMDKKSFCEGFLRAREDYHLAMEQVLSIDGDLIDEKLSKYEQIISLIEKELPYYANEDLRNKAMRSQGEEVFFAMIKLYKKKKNDKLIEATFQRARRYFGENFQYSTSLRQLASEYYKTEAKFTQSVRNKLVHAEEPIGPLYEKLKREFEETYDKNINGTYIVKDTPFETIRETQHSSDLLSKIKSLEKQIDQWVINLSNLIAGRDYEAAAKICELMIANDINGYTQLIYIYDKQNEQNAIIELAEEALRKWESGVLYFRSTPTSIVSDVCMWKRIHRDANKLEVIFPTKREKKRLKGDLLGNRFVELIKYRKATYGCLPRTKEEKVVEKEYLKIKSYYNNMLTESDYRVAEGRYDKAVEILEYLLSQNFDAYSRLILLYQESKLPEAVKEVAREALIALDNGIVRLHPRSVRSTMSRWEKLAGH